MLIEINSTKKIKFSKNSTQSLSSKHIKTLRDTVTLNTRAVKQPQNTATEKKLEEKEPLIFY